MERGQPTTRMAAELVNDAVQGECKHLHFPFDALDLFLVLSDELDPGYSQ